MNHALLRNRGLGRRGPPGPPRTRHPAHHAPPPRGRPPLAWTGILLLPGISQGRCRGAPRLQSRSAALAPGPPPHELAAEVTPPAPMCGRAHVCVCVCVCVRARACVCACVDIYTHINKYTHTHEKIFEKQQRCYVQAPVVQQRLEAWGVQATEGRELSSNARRTG